MGLLDLFRKTPPTREARPLAVPPERTFASLAMTVAQTYRMNPDEARRRSWENSLAMRRDCYVMSLLRERQLPVAQCPWHIEPEDATDPASVAAAKQITDAIKKTPYLTRFLLQMQEATWYGKYANQVVWGNISVCKRPAVGIIDHRPINGDKLFRQFDGTWCVQVNPSFAPEGADVVRGQQGSLLRLATPWWRDRFIIHQHEVDDADYLEWEMAGQIDGVGLRSRAAWCWELRDELLAWAMSFMEKVGTMGLLIFYFEEGNKVQEQAAQRAARNVSRRNALAVPVRKGGDKRTSGADLLPANVGGVEMLRVMIQDYFERHMERLIVGQSMSSGADNESGLGGSGRAALAANTKYQILKYDADNAADTLTRDVVAPLERFNFPGQTFGLKWVFDVADPAAGERLDSAKTLHDMGVDLKEDEVRAVGGFSKPDEGDAIIAGSSGMTAGLGLPGLPNDQPRPDADGIAGDDPPVPGSADAQAGGVMG